MWNPFRKKNSTEDENELVRVYGFDKTIHATEHLDVETDKDGHVVAVWFRCQPLPFLQFGVAKSRAEEMTRMYEDATAIPALHAVSVEDNYSVSDESKS